MTPEDLMRLGTNQIINYIIKWGLSIGKSYNEIALAIAHHCYLLQILEGL